VGVPPTSSLMSNQAKAGAVLPAARDKLAAAANKLILFGFHVAIGRFRADLKILFPRRGLFPTGSDR